MNTPIKRLLLALGLGFSSAAGYASCDPCDLPEPPAEANCPPRPPGPPSGSMPEKIIVDDMPSKIEGSTATASLVKESKKESVQARHAAK